MNFKIHIFYSEIANRFKVVMLVPMLCGRGTGISVVTPYIGKLLFLFLNVFSIHWNAYTSYGK